MTHDTLAPDARPALIALLDARAQQLALPGWGEETAARAGAVGGVWGGLEWGWTN